MPSKKGKRPRILLVNRAVVLRKDGKFLLIRRVTGDIHNPGLWEVPGGKLDEGQDLTNALEREVMEETGLLAEPTDRLVYANSFIIDKGPYKGLPYIELYSIGKLLGGKMKLSDEHSAAKFVTLDQALDLDLTPETRKALIVLRERL